MKTVFKIFSSDISSVVKQFFAFAIVIAICVLPALYAWVNIYANGDPYINTGNIDIAVASNDKGITLEDGTYMNKADEITDTLRDSTSIGWQFTDSAEEAIEGVNSGKYYAAIVFEDKFTYNMYNFEQALISDDAELTYYENGKKNAVASKITETAASTLLETINTEYLRTILNKFFADVNDVSEILDDKDVSEDLLSQLIALRDTLDAYDAAVDSFLAKSDNVRSAVRQARNDLAKNKGKGKAAVTAAKENLADSGKTLNALKTVLDSEMTELEKRLDSVEQKIADVKAAASTEDAQAKIEETKAQVDAAIDELKYLRSILPESSSVPAVQALTDTLDTMISEMQNINEVFDKLPEGVQRAETAISVVKNMAEGSLKPEFESMVSDMETTIEMLSPLVGSITDMLDDVDPLLDAAGSTAANLDLSLIQLQAMLRSSSNKLTDLIDALENADNGDLSDAIVDLLGADADKYSKFFSSLVDVEVEEIYSVASYGAAMTPFYSVLAIWVGGVILVSILKTGVKKEKFPDATEAQNYFGRFLIFFLVGQLQAAVIVAGDIFLLKCQPVHPWLMWLAASVTSLVFVLLIYSLTLSFGDVGKAIVVVVMVLQIAGSSGSYPIEILPEIFGKIYKFFPFPYAINAMREAICGVYKYDYITYLLELLLFAALALVIGLFVRRPFIGVNRFVSEKLEETEVL